jgi:hypothetical protein
LDNVDSEKIKTVPGYTSISTEVVTKISGELMSFDSLNAKIKKLEGDYEKRIHTIENHHRAITTVGAIVLSILVGAIVIPYAKTAWDWWATPITKPPTTSAAPTTPPNQPPQR